MKQIGFSVLLLVLLSGLVVSQPRPINLPVQVIGKPSPLAEGRGKDGSEMVLISSGEFIMGSDKYNDEKPVHKVYLDTYYIDKYEVTNEQYAKFLNTYGKDTDEQGNKMIYEHNWGLKKVNGRWKTGDGYEKHPVVCVTWYGANQYAKYYGKRLPTEAEWEKACRGKSQKYCFGNNESQLGNYAWYDRNSKGVTHPVGQKKPNIWGVYDMHGNVYEWCADWYDRFYYPVSLPNNPQGPDSGSYRILRGGCFNDFDYDCRSSNRLKNEPEFSDFNLGFRCVLSVKTQ